MDALKRAEASKKEAQRTALSGQQPPTSQPEAGKLSLEPLPGTNQAGKPLPELADHIAALDAELAVSSQPAPTSKKPAASAMPAAEGREPAGGLAEADKQAAARNAFAAKLATKPSQRPLWLALATLSVAAVGIGGYVWFQLQTMNSSSLAPVARPTQPSETRPTALAPAPQAPAIALAPPAAPAVTPPLSGATAGEAKAGNMPRLAAAPLATTSPAPRPEMERRPARSEAPAAIPIRLTRNQVEPDANAQSGYAKLQGNQLDAARQDYEQALRADPNNVDTLLTLAAIAQRQGRPADASRYQQRAIEADPRDAGAQAALLGSGSSGDPANMESRLKNLLAAQPESGPLNFALGNVYSRQARWPEAQQVYFNAVASDPDNPDYLFNLAVSLDHLRQAKVAAQHYRLALEAAQRRPPAFDPARARARLADLTAPADPR